LLLKKLAFLQKKGERLRRRGRIGDIALRSRFKSRRSHILLKETKKGARFPFASRKPVAAVTAEVTLDFPCARVPYAVFV
jgi:hypothetical protein